MSILLDYIPEREVKLTKEYTDALNELKNIYIKISTTSCPLNDELFWKIDKLGRKLWRINGFVPPCFNMEIFEKIKPSYEDGKVYVKHDMYGRPRIYDRDRRLISQWNNDHFGRWDHSEALYSVKYPYSHDANDLSKLSQKYFIADLDELENINDKIQWIAVNIQEPDLLDISDAMQFSKKDENIMMEKFSEFQKEIKGDKYILCPISFYPFWIRQKGMDAIYFSEYAYDTKILLEVLGTTQNRNEYIQRESTRRLYSIMQKAFSQTYEEINRIELVIENYQSEKELQSRLEAIKKQMKGISSHIDAVKSSKFWEMCSYHSNLSDIEINREIISCHNRLQELHNTCINMELEFDCKTIPENAEKMRKRVERQKKDFPKIPILGYQETIRNPLSPIIFGIDNNKIIICSTFGEEISPYYFESKGLQKQSNESSDKVIKLGSISKR